MTRPHILFVDDEARILSGLRRMLWKMSDSWDMSFALGSDEALAILADRPCQVIVSDFRMPGMDGGKLLRHVRETYPGTARVILSGHTEERNLLRVMITVHAYLSKPCQPEEIVNTVERVITTRGRVVTDAIRRHAPLLDEHPRPPSVLRNLLEALDRDDGSLRAVVAETERDPACAAALVHAANRLAGVDHPVATLSDAMAVLPLRSIRSLVLMHDLLAELRRDRRLPAEWIARHARHAARTASLAHHLAAGRDWGDAAYGTGLMREAGQLVLAACWPREYAGCLDLWAARGGRLVDVEAGTDPAHTHPIIGAYFLARWGVRIEALEAIVAHEPPGAHPGADDLASAVALAHAVVEAECGPVCVSPAPPVALDGLEPGVREAITAWRRQWEDG